MPRHLTRIDAARQQRTPCTRSRKSEFYRRAQAHSARVYRSASPKITGQCRQQRSREVFSLDSFIILDIHISSTFGMAQSEWSSQYSGYLQRAALHPNPHSYNPQRNQVTLIGLRDALRGSDPFSLAIFLDKTAIDMKGNVYVLDQEDYDGITELARAVENLPKIDDDFCNQWRVKNQITCRPIERILLPKALLPTSPTAYDDSEFAETSVYGFSQSHSFLQRPVDGHDKLPHSLWQLTGLVIEARETPGKKDTLVLEKVTNILGDNL